MSDKFEKKLERLRDGYADVEIRAFDLTTKYEFYGKRQALNEVIELYKKHVQKAVNPARMK